ncbi:MAG: hypothetical protein ACNFW9_04610 [Candidatus Kerfeldbacteria bacterium]|jgi:hypothetical protein
MFRRIVLIPILLLFVFVMGSCIQETDKYSKNDKDEAVVVDAKQVRIDSLQSFLKNLVDSLQPVVNNAIARSELIYAENQLLTAENSKLNAQLAQARDEVIPAMLVSYEVSYEVQRCAIEEKDEKVTSLNNDLWNVNYLNDALKGDRADLQTQLNWMTQWTKKYQQDSKRGFFKVLFGAGKAPVPDVPNPLLE